MKKLFECGLWVVGCGLLIFSIQSFATDGNIQIKNITDRNMQAVQYYLKNANFQSGPSNCVTSGQTASFPVDSSSVKAGSYNLMAQNCWKNTDGVYYDLVLTPIDYDSSKSFAFTCNITNNGTVSGSCTQP